MSFNFQTFFASQPLVRLIFSTAGLGKEAGEGRVRDHITIPFEHP